jgi:5-carboxymethyl-2-hydroxymuconic-semialdehyde dehydrogenase
MDKATPKAADVFEANRERAAPLLARLKALTVIPFRDERDAIEIANGVQHGLTGYVWTGDMGRALRVADALETGMIWLNSETVRHLPTLFGGMKSSGIGRDGGDYSFDFYMETKHVSLARGTHKIQRLGV